MAEQSDAFLQWAGAALEKIEEHYAPHYTIERGITFAGEQLALAAEMHNRQNVSIMGYRTDKPGLQSSEYLYVLETPLLDGECLARLEALLEQARDNYAALEGQAYTILSAVVLAGRIDAGAERALKRYKLHTPGMGAGGHGWSYARIAAVSPEGRMASNGDGKELRDLMKKVLRG